MSVGAPARSRRAPPPREEKLPAEDLLYEFNWKIINRCNYRCTYCPFTQQDQWEELTKKDVFAPVERWIEAWLRIYELYGPARINITGGEPSYYPRFIELIEALTRCHRVYITTNLSRKLPWVEEFARRALPHRLELPITFHPEFSEIGAFIEKACVLRKAGIEHWVYLVCYPPLLARLRECHRVLSAEGLRVLPTPFRGRYEGREYPHSYSAEEKAEIAAIAGTLDADNQDWVARQMDAINPLGMPCRAGQYYLHVENDGRVWRCGQYAGMKMEMPFGNFLDASFRLLDRPEPCGTDRCGCEWRFLEKYFRKAPGLLPEVAGESHA